MGQGADLEQWARLRACVLEKMAGKRTEAHSALRSPRSTPPFDNGEGAAARLQEKTGDRFSLLGKDGADEWPLSLEDRLILEAFVAGWPLTGQDYPALEEPCADRLLKMLMGAAEVGAGPDEARGKDGDDTPITPTADEPQPALIQSELWQVLHRIRESGDLFYARENAVNELDRRIVFSLQANGPLAAADLCNAMGVDKAQVSRSVKRLIDSGLAERSLLRSPLALTAEGTEVAWRLVHLAELRNRELTVGVTDEELEQLFAIIELLLDRAMELYEIERRKAHTTGTENSASQNKERGAAMFAHVEERPTAQSLPIDRKRIISPLLTLSAYFSRSGALAYRRLTGLSAFEAFVMSEIGRNPPISWNDLVVQLQRDHSQAGRTVTALIARGLVVREGDRGRRNGRFSHSEVGAAIYEIIVKVAAKRSVYLMTPLSADQRVHLLSTLAKIRRNADKQLDRERAFSKSKH